MQEHVQTNLQIVSRVFANRRQPRALQFPELFPVVEESQSLSLAVPIDAEDRLGTVQLPEVGKREGILSNIGPLYAVKWHRRPFVVFEQLGKINLSGLDGHADQIEHEYLLHRKGWSFRKSLVREVEAQGQKREYQHAGYQLIADFAEIAPGEEQVFTEHDPRPQCQRCQRER